jgi:hypothetical protein
MRIPRVSSKGAGRATPLAEPPMSDRIPDKVTCEVMTISRMTPRRAPSTTRVRSRHSTEREMLLDVRRPLKQSSDGSAHPLRCSPERYMNNCTSPAATRQVTNLLLSFPNSVWELIDAKPSFAHATASRELGIFSLVNAVVCPRLGGR